MFLQHACYLFLEGEKLLLVFSTHCALHGADVLPDLFLVLVADYVLDLNFFLDLVGLLCRGYGLRRRDGLLDGVCTVLFFVFFGLFLGEFFDLFDHFFCCLLWDLFGWLSWLWKFLFLRYNCVGTLRRHFILRIFGLQDLFHILLSSVDQGLRNRSITFLFLDGLRTLNLLYIFSQTFLLDFNTILTLSLSLCLVFLLDIVVDFVVLLA